MSDQNDSRPSAPAGTPVPDLIERYRLRREAWIAQADELARLRDEVRGAAEREAMEIVTAARRDVRQVIMEARRELLVLSAQVQAALGEVSGRPDPAALLSRGASQTPSASASGLRSIATEHTTDLFVPESAVKSMLDEARADIEALAEDAKTVPFQATALADAAAPEPEPASASTLPPAPDFFETVAEPESILVDEEPDISAAASRGLLSSPFPIDAVAVPRGRSVYAFVALFVVVGVVVLGGSYWWLKGRGASAAVAETRQPSNSDGKASASASGTSAPAPAAVLTTPASGSVPARLTVLVEARRESWIRTTRDGQSDVGRTYAAGEKVQLNADHDIAVRAGNAGAVYVSVNKGVAMPLGRDGQAMTRQFVADNPPAPANAAATPPAAVPPAAGSKAGTPSAPQAAASRPVVTPIPLPLVQPAVAASNPVQLDPGPPSVPRTEPSLPLPRTEAATAPAAAVPPPAASGIVPQQGSTQAVVAAARQWLDAYHHQQRGAMASLSTGDLQLADERRADERFPATMDVSRTLDRVSVQIAADTAVLTAVMTERGDTGTQRVSPISQVWVLSGGQWRVRQVRLVSEARLNQIFR